LALFPSHELGEAARRVRPLVAEPIEHQPAASPDDAQRLARLRLEQHFGGVVL